jgi:hypothetical protein
VRYPLKYYFSQIGTQNAFSVLVKAPDGAVFFGEELEVNVKQ